MTTPEIAPVAALEPKTKLSGKVLKTTLAGALVDVGQGIPGVIHISQLSKDAVNKVEDVVKEGQMVDVWVRRVKKDRIELTMHWDKDYSYGSMERRLGWVPGPGNVVLATLVSQFSRHSEVDVQKASLSAWLYARSCMILGHQRDESGSSRMGTDEKMLKYAPQVNATTTDSEFGQCDLIIEAIIGPNGKVQEAKVLRSIPLLDAAALDAVKQWEYTPTMLNNMPVPVIMTVTVNFTLQ
jgi:TonB family protein